MPTIPQNAVLIPIDMQRAFELMWRRAAGEERRSSVRFLVRQARGANVDPATAAGAVVGIIEGEPFRLRIARALQIQAVSAERCIWIANAYFVPSPGERGFRGAAVILKPSGEQPRED